MKTTVSRTKDELLTVVRKLTMGIAVFSSVSKGRDDII